MLETHVIAGDLMPTAAAPARVRLGMITPSSNTALEPITAQLFAGRPEITAHFARLRVTEISIGTQALAQFDAAPMLEAASMLADARPHAIVWNGTSGGWRGLDADRGLCAALEDRFGIPTTTVTLALRDLLKAQQVERIAFATPYTDNVQKLILETFAAEGFVCTMSPCLGISENFAFGSVSESELDQLVEQAAADRPQVIIPFCTNLPATRHATRWEQKFGIPIYDSIAIAARAGLELSGTPPQVITGWGSIFEI